MSTIWTLRTHTSSILQIAKKDIGIASNTQSPYQPLTYILSTSQNLEINSAAWKPLAGNRLCPLRKNQILDALKAKMYISKLPHGSQFGGVLHKGSLLLLAA